MSYGDDKIEKVIDMMKKEIDDCQGSFISKYPASAVADDIYWDYHFAGF